MAAGIKRCGDIVVRRTNTDPRNPEGSVVAYYGHEQFNLLAAAKVRAAGGSAIYIDLGWSGRRQGGRWSGYHKVVVNDRHPNAYFQRRAHDHGRAKSQGIRIQPWRKGGKFILLAGMSDRCAESLGYRANEWERWAVKEIRQYTDRPIVYRPKPSWKGARPIEGTSYSVRPEEPEDLFPDCWAVVTHHSNVAVDGIIAGVPAFVWDGVAFPMALHDLQHIERPIYPDGREQWIADICWQQWSVAEIERGAPWRYLKDEGLIQ